jgi:signal transduction histidine kinase
MVESIAVSQQELQLYVDEMVTLAVSSNVIAAVPRTENIYEATCNILIKEMGMRMAWVGIAGEDGRIHAIAACGREDGYLSAVEDGWGGCADGSAPSERAISTMHPQVVNDLATDPSEALWKTEAVKRGYGSVMAIPLITSENSVLSVLTLYSDRAGYFTKKRIRKFMIFANQAATAIENRLLVEDIEQRNKEIAGQLALLSQSQQKWQLTFDSITDLVSIHDADYRVIKSNKAFRAYCGLGPMNSPAQRCFELVHGTCSPAEGCPHKTTLNSQQPATHEIRDPKSNKLLRVSTFPFHTPDGVFQGSVHIARDITAEKDQELRLIMSERLASLGQMASGVAHEINNPLASIAGCSEGLLNRVKNGRCDADRCQNYFEIILDEVRRCKNITTSMLSFVRTSSYEKKEVSPAGLLDKTVEMVGFQGRLMDVDIVRNYGEDLPVIVANEGELRQVFLIIIMNALDAMGEQGRLELSTAREADSAVIRISDTGIGIPEKAQKNVFDPFFTTKMNTGGTGLGLSIARKIIMNHGGTITVHSDEGKGATFVITIPLH